MPGQNLTRTEAEARAAIVSTHSYDVDLDLTGSQTTFRSITTIRFAARAGAETFVDLIAESMERITLNGAPVDLAAFADSRIALTGLAAENELVVSSADPTMEATPATPHTMPPTSSPVRRPFADMSPSSPRRASPSPPP